MIATTVEVTSGWREAAEAFVFVVAELGLQKYALLLVLIGAFVFLAYRWSKVLEARADD